MNKQFANYEISLAVKELGFDELSLAYFWISKKGHLIEFMYCGEPTQISETNVAAPTWQQVIGFLNGILYKSHDKAAYSPEWIYFDGRDYEKLEKDVLTAIKIIKDGLPGKGGTVFNITLEEGELDMFTKYGVTSIQKGNTNYKLK